MDKREESRHHVVAKKLGGTWHEDNIIILDRRIHDCVHQLFDNDPPYQILRGVTEVYKKTMHKEAYELINGVLLQVERVVEAYNPRCFHGDALPSYLKNKGK